MNATLSAVAEAEWGGLEQHATKSIVIGLSRAWPASHSPAETPDLDAFLAGLVLHGAAPLTHAWREILSKHGIGLCTLSLFSARSPRVGSSSFRKEAAVLGDLLVVHTHRLGSAPATQRALYLRAHGAHRLPAMLPESRADEILLQVRWPDLTYVGEGPLAGRVRKDLPGGPHAGSGFLLIDERPPSDPESGLRGVENTYPALVCDPDAYLGPRAHLAEELVGLMLGESGKEVVAPQHASADPWSALVWDGVEAALAKALAGRDLPWHRAEPGASARDLDGASAVDSPPWTPHCSLLDAFLMAPERDALLGRPPAEPGAPLVPTSDPGAIEAPSLLLISTSAGLRPPG